MDWFKHRYPGLSTDSGVKHTGSIEVLENEDVNEIKDMSWNELVQYAVSLKINTYKKNREMLEKDVIDYVKGLTDN